MPLWRPLQAHPAEIRCRLSGFAHRFRRPKVRSEDKLDQSISRARARIFELAICNPWEFFVTLTLDPARYDRRDLPAFRRDLSQWIRNQRRLHGCDFRYLLIPEMHRDGAWHMHGLVAGLRESAFEFNANGYLDYPPYRDRFGFISLSRVRVPEAVARYITKYVSKDLAARRRRRRRASLLRLARPFGLRAH